MLGKFDLPKLNIRQVLILIVCLMGVFPNKPTLAQLTPDKTLGSESSVIKENVPVKGTLTDLIEGGAIRNNNLFHSFSNFNVKELQRVYFANPVGIDNILTRVTGANQSNILGTLGVNGNANLFLLNPHGIVFGKNTQLDIKGSFIATTADSVVFNGFNFSATNPEQIPLLNVSVPLGLQYGNSQPAGIINAGNLEVGTGSVLSLSGGTVINTGKLTSSEGMVMIVTVPSINNNNSLSELINNAGGAENLGLIITNSGKVILGNSQYTVKNGDIVIGGKEGISSIKTGTANLFSANNLALLESEIHTNENLNLLAFDTVIVRDSMANTFKAEAGKNLYIQGNKGIDILALNHPHAPFQSGDNLSLISDGIISGDAHFASGGNFFILNTLGKPGKFVSLYDPIISSEKDVIIGDYIGSSLKIESMGNISTGNIIISGADTTLTPNNDPDISILRSSPSLILRAGVEKLENPPTINTTSSVSSPPFPIITSSTPVYYNDFEGNVGSEWSNNSTNTTPVGNRRFLGQYGNNTVVNLNLKNLPTHQLATVFFDLFIIQTWDGNDINNLPDIWGLSVEGGLPLLLTTFSNHDDSFAPYIRYQSYPNNYNPFSPNNANNPARTGASENNTLGYTYTANEFGTRQIDSVYKLSVTFPHSNDTLGLNFVGLNLTGIYDESWGLDNVTVALQQAITPTGEPYPNITLPPPSFTTNGQKSPGNITTGNIITLGGPVILSAKNNINLNSSINTLGGDIKINSGGKIIGNASAINSLINDQDGGKITFQAGSDIISESNIRGKEVKIESGGNIDISKGKIEAISNDNKIAINLIANGDIFTNYLSSNGGDITLNSGKTINSTAGEIKSFSNQKGGNINLNANGDIFVGNITSSGDTGGGNIIINTNSNFFVEGNFTVRSDSFELGKGGNIAIAANSIYVKNGGQILSGSYKPVAGGDVTITAKELLDISGFIAFPDDFFRISVISTATAGSGKAGTLTVNTKKLLIRDGAGGLGTLTAGAGDGADLIITAFESVEIIGTNNKPQNPSGLLADTIDSINQKVTSGKAGNIIINTKRFLASDGGYASASTFNSGQGGNLILNASEWIKLSGTSIDGFPSGLYTQAFGTGNAGSLIITTPELLIQDGATITARSATVKDVNFPTTAVFEKAAKIVFSDVATGNGGNLFINTDKLTLLNGAEISARTKGQGNSGNININVSGELSSKNNSSIQTSALQSSGGTINIIAQIISLSGNGDIKTNVFNGTGGGGDINITANSILAFNDSDILAFSRDGKGGNIILKTPAFFGENYQPAPFGTDPVTLDGNNRVDLNASGTVNGLIVTPDVSFIENSLNKLPSNLINPDSLLANSCIVQSKSGGKFIVTGSGGLPERPGDTFISHFSTGNIQTISQNNSNPPVSNIPRWEKGSPIVAATGVYQLPNGQLFISHKCSE